MAGHYFATSCRKVMSLKDQSSHIKNVILDIVKINRSFNYLVFAEYFAFINLPTPSNPGYTNFWLMPHKLS